MPTEHVRRGRPKGSGLDDRAQLNAIAQLLETDRSLKPTTAIKRIGVTDPSTIRRLRDKLRFSLGEPPSTSHGLSETEPEDEPAAEIAFSGENIGFAARLERAEPEVEPAIQALVSPSAVAQVPHEPAPVSASDGAEKNSASPPASDETAKEWLTQLVALGLHSLNIAAGAQQALAQEMLRHPQVASALRHQIQLNEVAKAFCPTSSDVRRR